MAFTFLHFQQLDYDEWKQVFDSDPASRKGVAKGHQIFRNVENPGEVFLAVEYESVEDAKTVRDRLVQSGALDRFPPADGPTIVEVAEATTY